jgi:thiamine biosynthesis lipoprotein
MTSADSRNASAVTQKHQDNYKPSRVAILAAWVGLVCFVIAGYWFASRFDRPVEKTIEFISGRTMGTSYSVQYIPTANTLDGQELASQVQMTLERVNDQMSTYQDDSEISRFNQSTEINQPFAVSIEFGQVSQEALSISRATDGSYDVTVGPLVNLWGFGSEGSIEKSPTEPQVAQALRAVGYEKLGVELKPPSLLKSSADLQIDLSSIAKGHGVDQIANVLQRNGIANYFIEIGGEIRVQGRKSAEQPWRVGIELPFVGERAIGLPLEIEDSSLASSGNYRNYFIDEQTGEFFSHTIDTETGRPLRSTILAVSVAASTCASADGIATALMTVPQESWLDVANRNDWSALAMVSDQGNISAIASNSFAAQFPGALERLKDRLRIVNGGDSANSGGSELESIDSP